MLKLIDDGAPAATPIFSTEIELRWSDQDADGHVNNVIVLRLVEEARMRWASHLRLAELAPGLMSVVASLACVYKAPIAYPARVRVDIGCTHVGNSSVGLSFDLRDAGAYDTLYAQAAIAWVWVDAATRKSHAMPARLRAACVARA